MTPLLLLIVNFSATWFMTGLIWFVQLVHYPQFALVGREAFAAYHARHTRATSAVVMGPMLIELGSAVALLMVRPVVQMWLLVAGALLVVVIWLSTALLQVPRHRTLSSGFDGAACARLCRGNWLRVAAWSARAILMSCALVEAVARIAAH